MTDALPQTKLTVENSRERVIIHSPGSKDSSLADASGGFDREWFMGRWGVVWSTLPMWKDKKDVVITYTSLPDTQKNEAFDSCVEYRKRSAADGSKPSTVKGREILTPHTNGATFDWRGKGLLFFVSSHWEVLGYGKDEESSLQWAVTFFSKTLFTPAGIDIYLRSTSSSPTSETRAQLRSEIVEALYRVDDPFVAELAKSGFEIPGTV
ncbi:hypothetical protein M231_07727 [Tremella mesenterica]|uniref:Uncharacterized protein n=1 Tax=Tremella mesenterica TaxID=5217 RepID=A0A4Q1BBI7_TREME|nr:hypothetical protein M231_07727 [Tremella mesenterica]